MTVTLLHYIAGTLADRSLNAGYEWALSLGGKAALCYVFISNVVLESGSEMQDWSSIAFFEEFNLINGQAFSYLGQLEEFLILFLR